MSDEEPDSNEGPSPGHLARVERAAGLPGLTEALADRLGAADLRTLLLEVFRRRAAGRAPARILADFESDAYGQVVEVCPRGLARWQLAMLDALPPGFEALTLSPVAPLGTSSALAGMSQNRVVGTARVGEVVSDSTNVLALEAARRRRAGARGDLHLATHHRLLRHQRFPDPRWNQHFHVFALVSAGRTRGGVRFEAAALAAHVDAYLAALRATLGGERRYRLEVADLSGGRHAEALREHLLAPLGTRHPDLETELDLARTRAATYYREVAFLLFVGDGEGGWLELADGGGVDWTRKLLSNAKERCLISGLGSDRVVGLRG